MVTRMLAQWLFHPASALNGSIVVQLGKIDANNKVCGMWNVVCVYEIWLSVLDGSFVTQLGKIAGYGIWCMEWIYIWPTLFELSLSTQNIPYCSCLEV